VGGRNGGRDEGRWEERCREREEGKEVVREEGKGRERGAGKEGGRSPEGRGGAWMKDQVIWPITDWTGRGKVYSMQRYTRWFMCMCT